jgi:alcohol dehydrogenase (NADP+)
MLILIVQVGLPEEAMPPTPLGTMIFKNIHLAGSLIGSPDVIREMLQVAAKHNVKSWIQEWPLDQVNKALVDMEAGKPRYRYVLVNEKHKSLVRE